MPNNWKTYKLNEIADILNSKRIPLNSRQRNDRKGIFPYYGASGIVDFIDDFIFDGEHVLISEDGENLRSRNTPVAFKAKGKFWVNNHAHIVKGKEEFLNNWIVYHFSNLDLNPYISGAVQPKLNKEALLSIPIKIPQFEEAKQIASILSAIDDKIENNLAINKTLEEMAMALYKHWFVDFGPFQDGEFVESELGLIPKGWEVKRLDEIITVKRGGSPRPIQDFLAPDGLPWVKISDETASNSPYLMETKEFIKKEGLRKTVLLKKGSLILSNSASPGIPKFLELDACIHDGWLHFPEINRFGKYLLFLTFLRIKEELIQKGNGSVFTNLKTDILKSQLVTLPPNNIEEKINSKIKSYFKQIRSNSIENQTLTQLRDTLLPKLISGEVRLKEFRESEY